MSDAYIGEIRIVGFNFAPRNWAQCDGQSLPIAQNQALFSILGTTFGGNGTTNFNLPEMRGRVPVHVGNGITLGQRSGAENHTLIASELPVHNHQLVGSNQGETLTTPVGSYLATHSVSQAYNGTADAVMVGNETTNTGSSQPHNNMQPYQVLNIIICLFGIFPPRN